MPATIPDVVIGRLPLYLRMLNRLERKGVKLTSSHELGRQLGVSSAQIRKDLTHFGEFGKQGAGYRVPYLREQLARILQVDREWKVALVGAGNLGHALVHYQGFRSCGFHIDVIFDNDPKIIGTEIAGFVVQPDEHVAEVVRERGIQVAILAVTAEEAQKVADLLVGAGVRAILSYAPIILSVPEHVHVQYIDPVVHLQRMTYYL